MNMRVAVVLTALFLSGSVQGQTSASANTPPAIDQQSSHSCCFVLSVKLQDPFNRDFEIRTPVHMGKQFHASAKNGTVTNDISGTVRAAIAGKYSVALTVLEWAPPKSNMRDTTNFQLILGEPQSAGPISSFVYLRTVTLSRDEYPWHQVFRGRLAKVEVDQTLYERRKDEDCFIAVRVRNLADRPIGVDLRRFWDVIYPNSWGFSKTSTPEAVDEVRMIRRPMSPEDKTKLQFDFASDRLTVIRPNASISYFRKFTIGRNIRKEIDATDKQFLIVGLDGTLRMTDGQMSEEAIFPTNDDNSARWLSVPLPAVWQTVPPNSLMVDQNP